VTDSREFKIKTETFEGPLDLLLSLIEKRKLLINDISLAKVADDFINYIKSHESFPVAQTAHFILIASTLLLIKSKSLLPTLSLTEEENASIEDLEVRLKQYKRFKELSVGLSQIFGKKIIFAKNPSRNFSVIFSPTEEITPDRALEAARRVIDSLPKKEKLPKVIVQKIISLEDMIERLHERVSQNLKLSFADFAKTHGSKGGSGATHHANKEDKVNIIVSFLAMLELVKQGIIDVSQSSIYEDIDIETKALGVPKY